MKNPALKTNENFLKDTRLKPYACEDNFIQLKCLLSIFHSFYTFKNLDANIV